MTDLKQNVAQDQAELDRLEREVEVINSTGQRMLGDAMRRNRLEDEISALDTQIIRDKKRATDEKKHGA